MMIKINTYSLSHAMGEDYLKPNKENVYINTDDIISIIKGNNDVHIGDNPTEFKNNGTSKICKIIFKHVVIDNSRALITDEESIALILNSI